MDITIYSKDACQQCDMAKMFLDMKGYSYTLKKLNKDFTQDELKSLFPTARSFPIIIIDEENIGGYRELKERLN